MIGRRSVGKKLMPSQKQQEKSQIEDCLREAYLNLYKDSHEAHVQKANYPSSANGALEGKHCIYLSVYWNLEIENNTYQTTLQQNIRAMKPHDK